MGGHGGLNILPQKRWNVYNFDNREKVRKDEEQAAKDEQLKREQSRKHDSAIRIEQLRRVRGIDPVAPPPPPPPPSQLPQVPVVAESSSVTTGIDSVTEPKSESKSKHINLFEGIRIFDPVMVDEKKRKRNAEEEIDRRKKMRKELRERKEEVREVGPEDEVYRLGYGVAGKGVKAPWYAMKRQAVADEDEDEDEDGDDVVVKKEKKKKTVAELREERLKREKVEKERQLALLSRNGGGARGGGSYGRYSMDRERKQWRTGDRF